MKQGDSPEWLYASTRQAGSRSAALGRMVHDLARLTGISRKLAQHGKKSRVLMYHAIARHGLSADTFERQIRFLRKHFELIGLPEFSARHRKQELRGNEVAITFDDGVRNHYTTVYPILKKYDAPATFFVCPGLIDTGQWLWNVEMRLRLQSMNAEALKVIADKIGAPAADPEKMVNWAKLLGLTSRRDVESLVRDNSGSFRPNESQHDQCTPLTWEELKKLDSDIVTIGSHTMTHPILPTLTAAQAEAEIVESKCVLETQVGREVNLFCYPNGAKSAETVKIVERTYEYAVTTQAGFVTNASLPHLVPRIGAAEHDSKFQWLLFRP